MPVIVVGADTRVGLAIVAALLRGGGEVRAFVSDGAIAHQLRRERVKVARGDLSDGSHLTIAAANAHTAVLVFEAADADHAGHRGGGVIISQWVAAMADAGVKRIIGVGDLPGALGGLAAESALVAVAGRSPDEVAAEVAGLDARAHL